MDKESARLFSMHIYNHFLLEGALHAPSKFNVNYCYYRLCSGLSTFHGKYCT